MDQTPEDKEPRRSERDNKGVPPIRYGQPISGTPTGMEDPMYQSTPMFKLSRLERSKLGRVKEELEEDKMSVKSRASANTTASKASAIRMKQMQDQFEVEEERARMEDAKDERKLKLLQMKKEIEQANLEEELGSDGGSGNRDLDVQSVSSGVRSNHSGEKSYATASNIPQPDVVYWLNQAPITQQQTNPFLQTTYVQQQPPQKLTPSGYQMYSPILQSSNVQQSAPVLPSSTVQQSPAVIPQASDPNQYIVTTQQLLARKAIGRDLPYFSGRVEEWTSFISSYKRSTQACNYSPDENLARLQKCLKGEAREAVELMMDHPKKVDKIITTLEKRFGNPTHIMKYMLSKLSKVQDIKEGRPDTVIKLAECLDSVIDIAEEIDKEEYLSTPMLYEEIVKKFYDNMKIRWQHSVVSDESKQTLRDLSKWLQRESDVAVSLQLLNFDENRRRDQPGGDTRNHQNNWGRQHNQNQGNWVGPNRNNQHMRFNQRDNRNQVRVFNANEVKKDEGRVSNKKLCVYCEKGPHSIDECRGFKVLDGDRKHDWVSKKGLCFGCLKPGHQSLKCQKKKFCTVNECKSTHHPLLHIDRKKESKSTEEVKTETSMVIHENKRVLLSVLPVVLRNDSKEVYTYALLDSGSTVTMIDEEIAKELQVEGEEDPLHVTWMNNKSDFHHKSKRVSIGIKGTQGSQTFKLDNVRTMKNLKLPHHTNNSRELVRKWDHLKDLNIQDMKEAKVKMIIGNDNLNLSVPLETRKGPKTAPIASRTELGWLIHGKVSLFKNTATKEADQVYCCYEPNEDDLHKMVKESFTTENFGVKVCSQNLKSKDDIKAEEAFNKVTKRVGERWESGLLWKDPNVILPESKSQALNRLRGVEKKIDRDKEFAEQYNFQLEDYIKKGYARKLSKEEASRHTERTWYLPHFAVRHPHKPGKVRVVFDAAIKINGTSINEQMYTGSDNLNSLVGTLLKFREGQVGFTGDIKEMFHQIKMRKEDCSSQRFVWRGSDRVHDPDVYEMQVLIFGGVSSPFIAGEVKNRNALEFKEEFPEAVKAITQKHYVDDYLDSWDSVEEAISLINQVKEVHRRGGFEIGKWACSSDEVMKSVCPSEEISTVKEMNKSESSATRVLGLNWIPYNDKFTFTLNFHRVKNSIVSGEKNPTKREILKLVMSVFDPLGFLSCFTMKAKVLLQEVWKTGIGWDDEIPIELGPKWQQWIEELKTITDVEIPRCHSPLVKQAKSIQLHIFCDASQKAFSAAGYFRFEYEDRIETSFVMSKTKVAPININSMSIPRLELQAAVLGSRLASTIQEIHSFKIDVVHFWSDSTTVLGWIRATSKRFKQFVGHRIGEILESSEVKQWHWVPTSLNVADDATRDEKLCDLKKTSRWWSGPEFLTQDSNNWPVERENATKCEEEPVVQREYLNVAIECDVMDTSRHSTWLKLVRSQAWVFRFISKCRRSSSQQGELSHEELEKSRLYWIKKSQEDCFSDEIKVLREGKQLKGRNKLKKFSPYLDENSLVRMRSRIANSPEVREETHKPIILDPNHRVTYLLVQHYHRKNNHVGSEAVVNEVRQKYWIFNLRSLVRGVMATCQMCKNRRVKPQVPEMSDLPDFRVTRQERPFMMTGLDYFGPMDVTVGRRREKRYGALFTCLSTRAVHIELANSLTTDSAIMAIRRFMCNRGQPRQLFSDNGTNFKGADNELKRAIKELDYDKIASHLSNKGIEWKFIPPLSPHMGGAWERLVKSIKSALEKILKGTAPKEEVLRTSLDEAAYSVNSHPLTYVSSNPEDSESLTPNHFLIGPECIVHQMGKYYKEDLWASRWRASQYIADQFWRRWIAEYLPTLGKRSKWNTDTRPIEVGDVCLVMEDGLPRNEWQKGVVVAVHPSRDGRIRVVDLKMMDKKKNKLKIYTRVVAKLCVLDCKKTQDEEGCLSAQMGEEQVLHGEGYVAESSTN